MTAHARIRDLAPNEVKAMLEADRAVLVDVREPAEFAAERIEGALNIPLSTFDPAKLPQAGGRTVVLQCGSGIRSAKAMDPCRRAGLEIDTHLAGGIAAWKVAGLPTVR